MKVMAEESYSEYIDVDVSAGYSAGDSITYECAECGKTVPSMPKHSMACKCRNIIVDSDAGRVSVKDPSKFRIFTTE